MFLLLDDSIQAYNYADDNSLNRLLFRNGILNIRKRLEMTKVRPHRSK